MRSYGNVSVPFDCDAANFLQVFNEFWHKYVVGVDDHDNLLAHESVILGLATFQATPQQHNNVDCGLFTVGVVLHLLEEIPLGSDSFDYLMILKLRKSLSAVFKSKRVKDSNKLYSPNPREYLCNAEIWNTFPDLPEFDNIPNTVELVDHMASIDSRQKKQFRR